MIYQYGLGFQHLPRDLANVNAWKTMFDPYIVTWSVSMTLYVRVCAEMLLHLCPYDFYESTLFYKEIYRISPKYKFSEFVGFLFLLFCCEVYCKVQRYISSLTNIANLYLFMGLLLPLVWWELSIAR